MQLEQRYQRLDKQACDAMLASGMDAGMDEDFERLEALLTDAEHDKA